MNDDTSEDGEEETEIAEQGAGKTGTEEQKTDELVEEIEEELEEEVKEEKEEEEEEEPTREQLKEEVEDLESSLKKVMADFDNYRKRMNKEKKRIRKIAAEDLVTDLLEVLDDFERALEEDTEIEEDGVRMIYKKFYRTLSDHGLEEIEAEDEKFDPMYHECIQSLEKEDVEKDKIIEEYQKGYKLKDKVIRPAKVVVAK